MRLLHDGATYAQALESRIEREIEEQRQAEEAAALAKAKPKGPPAHLVGTEARPPFGGLAAGSSVVGGAPEVTTPPPGSGTLPRSSPTRPSSRPASSGILVDLYPGYQLDGRAFAWAVGHLPAAHIAVLPQIDRPGRAGYGTRNQSRRRDEPTNAWDAFRFPLHRPGADLRGTAVPHTVREWAADTWADAERLEAAIAAGVDISPQCVSAGVVLRSFPPTAQGGRLPRDPPPGTTTWFGWCFVKCPHSYRRDGTPCPDGARCLRPVNYPPLLGRPHEHHECARCAPPSGAAVRRLRRWLYIAWPVIYLLAWVAWFLSFCISPLGLGSRPCPHLRDTVSSGPRRKKECGRRLKLRP